MSVIKKQLLKSKYKVADTDMMSNSFLIDLDGDLSVLLTVDKDFAQILRLETSIIFDGDILNLKTYSDIANIFYAADMPVTGIYPYGSGKVKFYVNRTIPFSEVYYLPRILSDLREGISLCEKYLQLRDDRTKHPMIDISMFSDIDPNGFNPKDLGEKKDFIFGDWKTFISAVVKSHEDGDLSSDQAELMLLELKACESFEEKNKLMLSEVGDVVWQELLSYQNLHNNSTDDKTYIN
jgi:hypothetical protein